MCGINFILDKRKKLDNSAILAMNRATRHRGGDSEGWYCHEEPDRRLFFGHNRLKIIDLEDTANQPMHSPDGRFILVFNGEIYNFRELKGRLSSKYAFQTQSDSEVLLYALAEKQENALNGIFSYVWYDTQARDLRFARDVFGTKPLYLYEDDDYLILSSEIRGILASGLVGKELDTRQIYHYLAYRYPHPSGTFYQNIAPVPPMRRQEISKFRLQSPPDTDLIAELEGILRGAVLRQTVGDVPFGIFLSGGVDSTLLLALLQAQGFENLPVFTLTHPASERNFGTADYEFARRAAQQYGARPYTLEMTADRLKDLPDFVQTVEQPIADMAYWLTHLLAGEARKEVKFVLSGAGADELFAGYHRHRAYYLYKRFYPAFCLAYPALKLAKILPTGFEHPLRKPFRLLKKLGRDVSLSKNRTWAQFTSLFPPQTLPAFPFEPFAGEINPLEHDQNYYLSHDILALTDRASMRHALEVRVPYLDAEITTFAHRLPLAYLLKKGQKWLLKAVLDRYAGTPYTQRRKEGFGVPVGKWLRASVGKDFIALLQANDARIRQFLPAEWIQGYVKAHLAQQNDHTSELWALIFLELWLQTLEKSP